MAFKLGDFTATNAFYWSDTDLSSYAGTDAGSTPYQILLTDGAGKTASGFIGAVGAGETLTDVINGDTLNGNMETGSPPTGWTLAQSSLASVADERTGGSGSKSISITLTSAYGSAYRSLGVAENNKLFKISFWGKVITEGGAIYISLTGLTQYGATWGTYSTSWTNCTGGYLTSVNSACNIIVKDLSGLGAGTETRVDDVYVAQVTDPPSTGVHIVSAYGGTTRDWANIESGFNPNTITTVSLSPQISTDQTITLTDTATLGGPSNPSVSESITLTDTPTIANPAPWLTFGESFSLTLGLTLKEE